MDTLIQNCTIIDGSGAPAFCGSVGINGGKLSIFPGKDAPAAKNVVDGTGKTAVPGFVDAHSHGDLTLLGEYATLSKVSQGITTQIAGQCGVSMFPARCGGETDRAVFRRFVSGIATHPELPSDLSTCKSAESFLGWVESLDHPVHTKTFVGHGALRLWAMGYENREPDATELHRMKEMLRHCIREGALGLSTGLVYAPSCYAKDDELLSLLEVVRDEGGVYATHPRDEADRTVEARREALMLAKRAGVPMCCSHVKAAGRENWGKPKIILEDIDRAASEGAKLLIDVYPYWAGNTALNVSIPPRYFTEGMPGLVRALQSPTERERIRDEIGRHTDYDNYVFNSGGFSGTFVSSCPVDHAADGMFVTEYAEKVGMDPFDAYCDILIKNGGLGLGIYFHTSPDDVVEILRHPLTVVGTDGLLGLPSEPPHPRSFGSTARAFNLMVREKKCLTAEQIIRKMTGQTADFLHLAGKGYLKDGYDADLVLLDLPHFRDTAAYGRGNALTEGIERVYSNGRLVYRQGRLL